MTISLAAAAGRRVLSARSAEEMGTLGHVIVDGPTHRVVAICIGRRRHVEMVDWADVGFGPDAVMIRRPEGVRAPTGDAEKADAGGARDPLGKRVLTDEGDAMGTVTDVEIDEQSGALEVITVGTERVAAARLEGVGSYAVVVAAHGR